jgi:fructose-specific phosphotransferase system IIA component
MASKKSDKIRISGLLKEKLINLELKENDKKSVMIELVDLIARSKQLKNKKAFLKAMVEREKLGSTGIGGGLAIPHAKSDMVRDFTLVFGRKDSGIDFGALDGEKTYLFFALASPKNEVGGHLKILADISHLLKDKFIVELLKKAKSKKEILKIISDATRSNG